MRCQNYVFGKWPNNYLRGFTQWEKNSAEIDITYSDNANLVKDVENSANCGDSSKKVLCGGSVPHENFNATSLRIIGQEKVEKLPEQVMDHQLKKAIVSSITRS